MRLEQISLTKWILRIIEEKQILDEVKTSFKEDETQFQNKQIW